MDGHFVVVVAGDVLEDGVGRGDDADGQGAWPSAWREVDADWGGGCERPTGRRGRQASTRGRSDGAWEFDFFVVEFGVKRAAARGREIQGELEHAQREDNENNVHHGRTLVDLLFAEQGEQIENVRGERKVDQEQLREGAMREIALGQDPSAENDDEHERELDEHCIFDAPFFNLNQREACDEPREKIDRLAHATCHACAEEESDVVVVVVVVARW